MNSFLGDQPLRNDGEPARRKVRQPWPVSAFCVIGAMGFLNVVLGIFLIEARIQRPIERASSPAPDVPKTLDVPAVEPRTELSTPNGQSSLPNPNSASVQASPVPATSTAKPSVNSAKHPSRTRNSVAPKPAPQASPAPVHEPVPPSNASPSEVASVSTPVAGTSIGTERPRKTLDPPAAGSTTAAKDTHSSAAPKVARKVAPVRFPAIDKGWVPKTSVAPVSPTIEIIPREPQPKPENCGGDTYVPCPALHTRP